MRTLPIAFSGGVISVEGMVCNANAFLTEFIVQYRLLRGKENRFWRQRGNVENKLKKMIIEDWEKIKWLKEKAEREKNSKTYHALNSMIASIRISVALASLTVYSELEEELVLDPPMPAAAAAAIKMPLPTLMQLRCVDPVILDIVAEKMKTYIGDDADVVEKQFYLAELLVHKEFIQAEKLAIAIRSAWPCYEFEQDVLGIFVSAATRLMKMISSETDVALRDANTIEKEKQVLLSFDKSEYAQKIVRIFSILSSDCFSPLYRLMSRVSKYAFNMRSGICATTILKSIVKKLLHEEPILPNDIKQFFTLVDSAFVWVGGEGEQVLCLSLCRAGEAKKTSLRMNLCKAIYQIIEKSVNSEAIAMCGDIDHAVSTSKITPANFINVVDALLCRAPLLEGIKAALTPIWTRADKLAKAGSTGFSLFRDEGSKLHQKIIEQAHTLRSEFLALESLSKFRYDFDYFKRNSVQCDLDRRAYEKEECPVKTLLPIKATIDAVNAILVTLSPEYMSSDALVATAKHEIHKEMVAWQEQLATVFDCALSTRPEVPMAAAHY